MCLCVCVRALARAFVCVRACACVRETERENYRNCVGLCLIITLNTIHMKQGTNYAIV